MWDSCIMSCNFILYLQSCLLFPNVKIIYFFNQNAKLIIILGDGEGRGMKIMTQIQNIFGRGRK